MNSISSNFQVSIFRLTNRNLNTNPSRNLVIYGSRKERMVKKKGSCCLLGSVMILVYIWIRKKQMTTSQKKSIQMRNLNEEPMDTPAYAMDLNLLPNEINEEFLIRVPVKSLTRLKCVTRDWNDLISDSSFRIRYQSRQQINGNTPTGFICGNKTDDYAAEHGYCVPSKFLYSSENYVVKEELESFKYLNKFGYLIAASKGLLLLGHNPKNLYVYDLVSKKHVKLPRNKLGTFHDVALGFKCKERSNNRFCYEVVCVDIPSKRRYEKNGLMYNIEIYSSETGFWQKSIMKSKHRFHMQPHSASKVIGGMFHWDHINEGNIIGDWIVAYDSDYDSDYPRERVVVIQLPTTWDDKIYGKMIRQIEGTKDGSLQFISIDDMVLNVWILKSVSWRSYMENGILFVHHWFLASKVSLCDIGCGIGDTYYPQEKKWRLVCADPVDPHIIYLDIADQLYAYNYREGKVVFTFSQKITTETDEFVHFEWPTWPRL